MKNFFPKFLYTPVNISDISRNEAESKAFESCCCKLYQLTGLCLGLSVLFRQDPFLP